MLSATKQELVWIGCKLMGECPSEQRLRRDVSPTVRRKIKTQSPFPFAGTGEGGELLRMLGDSASDRGQVN